MRLKGIIVYILLAAAVAGLLCACGIGQPSDNDVTPTPAPPEEFSTPTPVPWAIAHRNPHSGIFGVAWSPGNIEHPLLTTDRLMREMYNLLYDGLFVLDSEFVPHNRLCAEIESSDNVTFVLTLKRNVSFNDGQPLTAKDVVDSIQTARSAASPYAARLACIVNARAVEESVEITLNAPNPRFAALLTFPIVGAKHDEGLFWAGTGPYEHTRDNESDYLIPYDGRWARTKIPLERIELISADKLEELTYLMGAGEVSIATLDINDGFSVAFSGDYDVWEYPTPTMYYMGFNTEHDLLALSGVRKALSSAFDRQGLVERVFGGVADAASLPVPPVVHPSGDGFDLRIFTDIMRELEAEDIDSDGILDFKTGRNRYAPFALRIITDETDTHAAQIAEYLAAELTRSGVSVEILPLSPAAYAETKASGEYELYCEKITLPADFSVKRWLSPYRATNTSISSDYLEFSSEAPIAPLLFKREYTLTHRSQVSGIAPVYGNPYVNISEWSVKH